MCFIASSKSKVILCVTNRVKFDALFIDNAILILNYFKCSKHEAQDLLDYVETLNIMVEDWKKGKFSQVSRIQTVGMP